MHRLRRSLVAGVGVVLSGALAVGCSGPARISASPEVRVAVCGDRPIDGPHTVFSGDAVHFQIAYDDGMTDVIVEQTEGTVTLTDEHAVEIGRMGVSQLMHETTSLGGAAIPIYESDVAVAVIGLAGPEYTGNSEETAVIGITAVCPGEAEYEELLQYPSEGFGPTRPESVPAPATTTTLGELLVA